MVLIKKKLEGTLFSLELKQSKDFKNWEMALFLQDRLQEDYGIGNLTKKNVDSGAVYFWSNFNIPVEKEQILAIANILHETAASASTPRSEHLRPKKRHQVSFRPKIRSQEDKQLQEPQDPFLIENVSSPSPIEERFTKLNSRIQSITNKLDILLKSAQFPTHQAPASSEIVQIANKFEKERNQLQRDLHTMRKVILTKNKELSLLQQEKTPLIDELVKLREERSTLRLELGQTKTKLDQTKTMLYQTKTKINMAKKDFKKAQKTKTRLQKAQQLADKEKHHQKNSIAKLHKERATLKEHLEQTKTKLKQVQKDLISKSMQLGQTRSDLKNAQKAVDGEIQHQKKIEEERHEVIAKLQRERIALIDQLERWRSEGSTVHLELNRLKTKSKKTQKDLEKVQQDYIAEKQKVSDLEKKLEETEKNLADLHQERVFLMEELEKQKSASSPLRKELEQERLNLGELQRNLEMAQQDLEKTKELIAENKLSRNALISLQKWIISIARENLDTPFHRVRMKVLSSDRPLTVEEISNKCGITSMRAYAELKDLDKLGFLTISDDNIASFRNYIVEPRLAESA